MNNTIVNAPAMLKVAHKIKVTPTVKALAEQFMKNHYEKKNKKALRKQGH